MAEFIDDSGLFDKKAELSGTYTKRPDLGTIVMEADGQAVSQLTIPTDEAWLLVETYSIGGTLGILGYSKYQTDVTQVDADLLAIYTLVDDKFVNFSIKATLFDGVSEAKVYNADQATPFPLEANPSYTVAGYTPTGTWTLSQTPFAPEEGSPPVDSIYDGTISAGTSPSVTYNDLTGGDWNLTTTSPTGAAETFILGTTESFEIGVEYTWAFNAEYTSGTFVIAEYFQGGGGSTIINHTVTEGYNEVKFTDNTSFEDEYFQIGASNEFNVNITDSTVSS